MPLFKNLNTKTALEKTCHFHCFPCSVQLMFRVIINFRAIFVGWSPVMKIGAIDCAVTENFDTCTSVEIPGYPELKVRTANT